MAKIIIIDDEREICKMLKEALEEKGYEVKFETNPLKGLELIEKEKPHCVLLDIKMPELDGIEVLSRIKQISKNTDVIMMTAYSTLETAMEALKLGAYYYVTKPFDLKWTNTLIDGCVDPDKKHLR